IVKFGCQRRATARTQPSQPLCATQFLLACCTRGASLGPPRLHAKCF
ncbi:unnamed protein product, partial [Musa textilis]